MQARRSGTIMRSMRAALLAFALLLLLPAAAPAKTLDLPTLFEDVLPKVKDRAEVPVLLPQGAGTAHADRSTSPGARRSTGRCASSSPS